MNLLKLKALDLYGNMKSYLKYSIIIAIIVVTILIVIKLIVGTVVDGGNTQFSERPWAVLMEFILYVLSMLPLLMGMLLSRRYFFKNNRGNNTEEIEDNNILSDTIRIGLVITSQIYVLIGLLNILIDYSISYDLMRKNMVAYVIINILLLAIRYLINASKYEVSESQINSPVYAFLKFNVRKKTVFYHVAIIIIGSWVGANVFEGINDNKLSLALFIIAAVDISAYTILFIKNFVINAINFLDDKTVKKEVTNLNLKNINISVKLFNELPLFNLIRYPKADLPVMSFLLDLNDVFPNNAEERSMYFEDYAKPYKKGISEFKYLTDNQAILLFDYNYDHKINTYNLKVRISYKIDDKYIGKFINLVIGLESREGIVLPVQKYVYDYKEYKYKKSIDFSFMTNAKKAEESNHNLVRLKALRNVFWYSVDSLDSDAEIIKQRTTDKRKVVVHSDDLGIGKTTYDIIKTTNHGMIPIVVSAWQSNYDHDILYLIFDTIRRQTNTKSFGKDNSLFYMVFFVACLGGIKAFVDLFLPGVVEDFSISKQITVAIIGFISLVIITKEIWNTISYKFLILKKDNTKVYKDFYIDEIIRMLIINSNYILVIEDVDRLNPEAISEVFRILSSINSRMPLDFRRFAIISYSEETVNSKLKSIGVDYSDVYNKIVSPVKWADVYNPYSSMILNSKQNICNAIDVMKGVMDVEISANTNGCNGCPIWGIDKSQLKAIEEKISDPNNKLNFRNIVSVCEMMNKEIHDSILSGLGEQNRQKFKYSDAKSIYKLFNDKLDQEIIATRFQQNNREVVKLYESSLPQKKKNSAR